MASYFHKGTVIEGAYNGLYVYGIKNNQLQIFPASSVNSWKVDSGQMNPRAVIDKDTVSSLELLQEREKGVDAADVGGATLLLGPIMGAAMYADGKKKLYYVNVNYKNGLRSLIKIESELFDIVQRIAFELSSIQSSSMSVSGTANSNIQTNKRDININPDNIEPTITRIEIFIEDKEWDKATAYAEAALDFFPTDYRLYKYLLLSDLKCQSVSELKRCKSSFASNDHYKKLIRYADEPLKKEINGILEDLRKEDIYQQACASEGRAALAKFKTIKGYKDADKKAASLERKIIEEETREKQEKEKQKQKKEEETQTKYLAAIELQENASDVVGFKKAVDAFDELKGLTNDGNVQRHYDVVNRYKEVKEKYDELATEKEYADAVALLATGELSKVKAAKQSFAKLKDQNDYKDSREKYEEASAVFEVASKKRKKKIIAIIICIVVAVAAAIIGGNILSKNMKQNWLSKQYNGNLKTAQVENLSFSIPESFVTEEYSHDDTCMGIKNTDYEHYGDEGTISLITIDYDGLTLANGMNSYIKEYDRIHDGDDWYFKDSAYNIKGEGYSGKEACNHNDYYGAMEIVDIVTVDESVFEISLSIQDEYYSEGIMEIVRDHIDWTEYKSNRIKTLIAKYEGDKYPGDYVYKRDFKVTAVRENGERTDVDNHFIKLEFPKGDEFKEKKSLPVVIKYKEGGVDYETTINIKCEERVNSYSSGSSSSGNYHPGDKNGEAWDTNNDGSVSGNEFQDAVNDYMNENGF